MKVPLIFAIAIAVAGYAGYATQRYLKVEELDAAQRTNPVIGSERSEFAMKDLEGKIRNIKEWDGKVVLLNFWATWCPPCRKEMPHFIELQDELGDEGLQIIGVAMDEPEDAAAFAGEIGVNYPILPGNFEVMELIRRYGNAAGALPYTVIIDKNATVHSTFAGEMSKEVAIKRLRDAGLGG